MAFSATGVTVALALLVGAGALFGLRVRWVAIAATALLVLAALGWLTGAALPTALLAEAAFYLLLAATGLLMWEESDRFGRRRAAAVERRERTLRWTLERIDAGLSAAEAAWSQVRAGWGPPVQRFLNEALSPERRRRLSRLGRVLATPAVGYLLVALLVTGPFFARGYLLALDMVFGPNMDWTRHFLGTGGSPGPVVLWEALMTLWGTVLPFSWFQKGALAVGLATMGWGMHRIAPSTTGWGRAFAGLLYLLNPFVYMRLVTGQYLFLVSLAALPLAFAAFRSFLRDGRRTHLLAAALGATIAGTQVHMLGLTALLFGAYALVDAHAARTQAQGMRRSLRRSGGVAAGVVALNAFWWVPFLVSSGVAGFTTADVQFFSARPSSNLGVGFDLLSMYGFWRGGYATPRDTQPLWWAFVLLFLYLAVLGATTRWADPSLRRSVRAVVLAGGASLGFAIVAASPVARPAFTWLVTHVFLLGAFRDSQKFVALVLFGYAFLGAAGVDALVRAAREGLARARRLRRPMPWLAGAMALGLLAAPAVNAHTMLGGMSGQLAPSPYPSGWYEARDYLNERGSEYAVLFLPWHQYMDLSFVKNPQKRIANPAAVFFDQHVIQGDNWELPGSFTRSADPVSAYVEALLFEHGMVRGNPNGVSTLGNLLAPLNVRYVVLAKEADHFRYGFLDGQTDLQRVLDNAHVAMYENRADPRPAWTTAVHERVNTTADLVALSERISLTSVLVTRAGTVPVASVAGDDTQHRDHRGAGTERHSMLAASTPVRWKTGGHLVVPLPQRTAHDGWRLGGEAPEVRNAGFQPTFAVEEDGADGLRYQPFFTTYMLAYAISGGTLLALAIRAGVTRRAGPGPDGEAEGR